ncbi:MAG: polysaccharide pyruvyl transferase family protein [Clostridia bacterium]|nr:polysaccharide pyruvyl transferase family protein [Clostridia bacterium]
MENGLKKVGILTFHASHNYGSCLQAYALQTTLKSLGVYPEIINFRTSRQKELYAVFTKKKGIMRFLKNLTHLLYFSSFKSKHNKFECFIKDEYVLSKKEYVSLNELEEEIFDYDVFLAGSDQIWNPFPSDFDWAYYLPFVRDVPKISYAPSFGPAIRKTDDERMKSLPERVANFSHISVREPQAKAYLESYVTKEVSVVLDPTLLLNKNEWLQLVDKTPIVKGDYIFLYTLYATPVINKIAKRLSKKWKIKVVVSNVSNQHDAINSFKKQFSTGPKEFLNLIYYAKFVLVTSFHGTVFSVLFEKPFFAINGEKDNRIFNLLSITGLKDRTVNLANVQEKANTAFQIDFSSVEKGLQKERRISFDFLRKALELGTDEDDM